MNRQSSDPGLVFEGDLHAVPVVRVDVDIENALQPGVEERQDRQDRVVEIAKAARPVRAAVMGAARRVVDDARPLGPVGQEPRGQQGSAARGGRPAENLWEYGVAVSPKAETLGDLRLDRLVALRGPHGGYVVGVMETRQFLGLGTRAHSI